MPNQILENIKKHNCYNISYIQSGERYIYTYTKKFFCFFKIKHTQKKKFTQNTEIRLFLRQFYLCIFTKIKFTGKGYKIKKNNKHNFRLLFNRAHITSIF